MTNSINRSYYRIIAKLMSSVLPKRSLTTAKWVYLSFWTLFSRHWTENVCTYASSFSRWCGRAQGLAVQNLSSTFYYFCGKACQTIWVHCKEEAKGGQYYTRFYPELERQQWWNVTTYIYSCWVFTYNSVVHITWVFPFYATLYFYSEVNNVCITPLHLHVCGTNI